MSNICQIDFGALINIWGVFLYIKHIKNCIRSILWENNRDHDSVAL